VGGWYWIGVSVGIGVALGVALAGILGVSAAGVAAAVVAAVAGGVLIGFLIGSWHDALGGGVGGALGALGTARLGQSSLRAGGTRIGNALLLGVAGVVLAAIAFIPVAGYLEAVVVPAIGVRLQQRAGRRYAGLRTLARD
jgi:hypothetical protein